MKDPHIGVVTTFEEVRLLIHSTVHAFQKKHGGDYDDLFAEASFLFLRTYHSPSWRPDGGASFSTWVATCVWRGLKQNHTRDQLHSRHLRGELPYAWSLVPSRAAPSFNLKDFLGALSKDGRTVAKLTLNGSMDVKIAIAQRGGDDTPHHVRSAVKEVLEDMGWSKYRIKRSFLEVTTALKGKIVNKRGSEEYARVDKENLNQPLSKLRCPRCESKEVEQDKELTDHPGCFMCKKCREPFCA